MSLAACVGDRGVQWRKAGDVGIVVCIEAIGKSSSIHGKRNGVVREYPRNRRMGVKATLPLDVEHEVNKERHMMMDPMNGGYLNRCNDHLIGLHQYDARVCVLKTGKVQESSFRTLVETSMDGPAGLVFGPAGAALGLTELAQKIPN
ncbi:hypothetical protein Tco_1336909 [Tanacetum coccineum]